MSNTLNLIGALLQADAIEVVGYEGPSLDKHLYEFFEIDPGKIDEERRMFLESKGGGS